MVDTKIAKSDAGTFLVIFGTNRIIIRESRPIRSASIFMVFKF